MPIHRFVYVEAICNHCGAMSEDAGRNYSLQDWIVLLRERGWLVRGGRKGAQMGVFCPDCRRRLDQRGKNHPEAKQ